jgi:hypothetical protein
LQKLSLEDVAGMDAMPSNSSMVFTIKLWLIPIRIRWLHRWQRFWSYMSDAQ